MREEFETLESSDRIPGHGEDAGRRSEMWRLLPSDVGSSIAHFARSDALVRLVRVPTVWWHWTDRPTLIVGAGQRVDDGLRTACHDRGILLVHRQSGGTSVFASSHVLGLDVALPAGHPLLTTDVVEAYHWLGEVWAAALSTLNVDARLLSVCEAREAPPLSPDVGEALRAACFGTLSPYEVVVRRRKVVGLAQVRRRAGALLQSAVHLHFDADTLGVLLNPSAPSALTVALRRVAAGLDEVGAGSIAPEDVMLALQTQLQLKLRVRLQPGDWTGDEVRHAEEYVGGVLARGGLEA